MHPALEAAKGKLAVAKKQTIIMLKLEVAKEIARLGYEEARLQVKSNSENLAKEQPVKNIADVRVPERQSTADPRAESWAGRNGLGQIKL